MGLNDYRNEAGEFLRAIGARQEDVENIFHMLDGEAAALRRAVGDRPKLQHQVYDVLFLLFELADRFDLDLDAEWTRGRERKRRQHLDRG